MHKLIAEGAVAAQAPARRVPVLLVLAGIVVAGIFAAACLLWAHYGTTVFFEMVAAGIAACL